MDNQDQGYLTKDSLLKTFKRHVRNFSLQDVENMMEEVGLNADDMIDFEQLRSLIDPNYKSIEQF